MNIEQMISEVEYMGNSALERTLKNFIYALDQYGDAEALLILSDIIVKESQYGR